KLAEGAEALVFDVKVGAGAFMESREQALALGETLVEIASSMGRRAVARLTDMEQPLGRTVGNALEIVESVEVLRGGGPPDVVELTVELGAEMLVLGRVADDLVAGRKKIRAAIADGSGYERLLRIVEAQGGDPEALRDLSRLP